MKVLESSKEFMTRVNTLKVLAHTKKVKTGIIDYDEKMVEELCINIVYPEAMNKYQFYMHLVGDEHFAQETEEHSKDRLEYTMKLIDKDIEELQNNIPVEDVRVTIEQYKKLFASDNTPETIVYVYKLENLPKGKFLTILNDKFFDTPIIRVTNGVNYESTNTINKSETFRLGERFWLDTLPVIEYEAGKYEEGNKYTSLKFEEAPPKVVTKVLHRLGWQFNLVTKEWVMFYPIDKEALLKTTLLLREINVKPKGG